MLWYWTCADVSVLVIEMPLLERMVATVPVYSAGGSADTLKAFQNEVGEEMLRDFPLLRS